MTARVLSFGLLVTLASGLELCAQGDLSKGPLPAGLVPADTAAATRRSTPDRSDLALDVEAVYGTDTGAKATRVLSQKQIDRPNGIAAAPDGRTLYVIDSHPRVGGNRKVWAFAIAADGSLSQQRLVC